MSVPSRESKRSCICVLVILILPPFTIFLFYFGIVPTALYFLFFILLIRNTFFCSCRDFDIKTVFVLYSYLFKEYTLHTVAMKTKWLSVPESLFNIQSRVHSYQTTYFQNILQKEFLIQFSYFSLLIKKSYYNISIYCFNLVPSITKLYVNRSSVSSANIWLGLIYDV